MKLTVAHRNRYKALSPSSHQSANYELAIIDDEFSFVMLNSFRNQGPIYHRQEKRLVLSLSHINSVRKIAKRSDLKFKNSIVSNNLISPNSFFS